MQVRENVLFVLDLSHYRSVQAGFLMYAFNVKNGIKRLAIVK